MSHDQASKSSLREHSFQPFDSLPDEVLLLLLDQLTPFQRCLVLSICKKWNHAILQRKSWWQYLDIPYHFPFSTALSILQAFNSRSNFTLKHIILQPIMETSKEVDEVFAELKKSSGYVKLLFLNQRATGRMLTARRAARKFLTKLNTFYCTHPLNIEQDLDLMWDERDRAEILDEPEKGLQFLQVGWLGRLEPDDLEWCSKLKYLSVDYTDSFKTLCNILEVSKGTLRRLRLDFWKFDRNQEEPDLIRANGFKRINLPNLETIFTPSNEASAAALASLIDLEGQKSTLFIGLIHSLLQFDFPSLEQVRICTYESKALEGLKLDEEGSKLKTTLFFERNPSISQLILDHGLQDEKSFHFNYILHALSIARINAESSRESQSLLLPDLQSLTIRNPSTLDMELLEQFLRIRKVVQEDFKINLFIEGKGFTFDLLESEESLNEAENW